MGNTESLPDRFSFDRSQLRGDEFRPYMYSAGKLGFDMTAAGYLKAIHPFLRTVLVKEARVWNVISDKAITNEQVTERAGDMVAQGGVAPVKMSSSDIKSELQSYLRAEVVIHLILNDGSIWESSGDADEFSVNDPSALLRIAETRAFKRAVARALNISMVDLNSGRMMSEEEPFTPLDDHARRHSVSFSGKDQSVKPRLPSTPSTTVAPTNGSMLQDW
jgi:hypothetical protein